MLSLLEIPVSSIAAKSGIEGGLGGVVSTVIDKGLELTEVLPAMSVALAVMEWTPSAKVISILQLPPVAVVVSLLVTPSKISTLEPASAVPDKVKPEVFLVMLSVLELPVSSAESKSGIEGAATVVSTVTDKLPEATEGLPAASVALAVIE